MSNPDVSTQESTNPSYPRITNAHTARDAGTRWIVAVLLLVIASLAYPALRGAFLVTPESAQYINGYALREFAAQSLRSGNGFPQWNSFLFGGMPYAASTNSDIFYPTLLLRLLLPTDIASTWSVVLHCVLAGVFTFRFLRTTGVTIAAALFGALSYMLSGPLASVAASGRDSVLFVATMFPLALWMVMLAIRTPRRWAWGVFALVIGFASLAGDFAALQAMLLATFAFALLQIRFAARDETDATRTDQIGLVLASATPGSSVTTEQRLERAIASNHARLIAKHVATLVAVILSGLLIGSIHWWPALAYAKLSVIAVSATDAVAARHNAVPPEDLLNTLLPQFSGILMRYWGRGADRLQSVYAGAVVLIFAFLAIGYEREKASTRLWIGTLLAASIWLIAPFTPLYAVITSFLPTTDLARTPSSAVFVGAFATCTLAALGFQRALDREITGRKFVRVSLAWTAVSALILTLVLSGALNAVAHEITRTGSVLNKMGDAFIAQRIDANSRAQLLGAYRTSAIILGSLLAAALYARRAFAPQLFAVVIIAISCVDQWSIARLYWQFSKPASELFEGDAISSYVLQQPQPGRVFVYTTSADYRTATDPYFGASGFGDAAGLMIHRVRTTSGSPYNPLSRYARVVNKTATIDSTVWQHENVRWIYTSVEITDTTFRNVVTTTHNSANSRAFLYEVPGDHPYAWVASSYGTRDDSAAAREVLRASHNPRTFTSVDSGATINGKAVSPAPALFSEPSRITTTVRDFSPGHVTVQLSAPSAEGNLLVISENFYDGWTASSNGQSLPVMRSAFNLVGVALPAGTSSVTLVFTDPRYVTGRAITLVALFLTASLMLMSWRRRHQTAAPFADAYRMKHDDGA